MPEIFNPVPEYALPQTVNLWRSAFGFAGTTAADVRAANAIALMSGREVSGVIGLRDHRGGFLMSPPRMARLIFRPAPTTADLVIDGIIVAQRRQGTGRALIHAAESEACRRGRSGLRAEVQARNQGALAFYRSLGFVEVTRGRFGWPWSGMIVVLRKAI